MSRNEQERLRDIKDAIASIHGHLARARKQPEAGDDALLHDALLFLFAVIGEGVKSLTPRDAARRRRACDYLWAFQLREGAN